MSHNSFIILNLKRISLRRKVHDSLCRFWGRRLRSSSNKCGGGFAKFGDDTCVKDEDGGTRRVRLKGSRNKEDKLLKDFLELVPSNDEVTTRGEKSLVNGQRVRVASYGFRDSYA